MVEARHDHEKTQDIVPEQSGDVGEKLVNIHKRRAPTAFEGCRQMRSIETRYKIEVFHLYW
jgi:hypothetical protein